MRAVTHRIVAAFLKHESAKAPTTQTDGASLYLHGHRIAWHGTRHDIWVDTCGWPTRTTLDRLNAVVELKYRIKGFFRMERGRLKAGNNDWEGGPFDLRTRLGAKLGLG